MQTNIFSKYLVCPPLFWMTDSILLGMEDTSVSKHFWRDVLPFFKNYFFSAALCSFFTNFSSIHLNGVPSMNRRTDCSFICILHFYDWMYAHVISISYSCEICIESSLLRKVLQGPKGPFHEIILLSKDHALLWVWAQKSWNTRCGVENKESHFKCLYSIIHDTNQSCCFKCLAESLLPWENVPVW